MQVKLAPRDAVLTVATFAAALALFMLSPVRQYADSHYSLLVSESLLRDHTTALDRFFVPPLDPRRYPGIVAEGGPGRSGSLPGVPYQMEESGGTLQYRYPPGSSLLSLPFVAALRHLGLSSIGPDGRYDAAGEHRQQALIASFLMAVFAGLCYAIARVALPRGASLGLTAAAALATPVWSTASRGLWSHSWGLVLLGLVMYLLLRSELAGSGTHPVLLGTLLSWAFFVRPVYAISALAATALVARRDRRAAARMVVTGGLWLAAFLLWNQATRDAWLPGQYQAGLLSLQTFVPALVGHLASPSRGLLIFCPWVLMVLWAALRAAVGPGRGRDLVVAGVAVSALHLIAVASLPTWWGGDCYGPRLMTDLVPWFLAWAVVGLRFGPRLVGPARVLALLSLAWSVGVHGRGALSPATWAWNMQPWDISRDTSRLWDWSDPQFLAGLLGPTAPGEEPLVAIGSRLSVASRPAVLFRGWRVSGSEAGLRGRRGILAFRTDRPRPDLPLRLRFGFAAPLASVVAVRLDGDPVGELSPAGDAVLHLGPRPLGDVVGIALEPRSPSSPLLEWIELDPEPHRPPQGRAIAVGTNEAEPYLGPGWSWPEGRFRWTEGTRAEVRFLWTAGRRARLLLRARPFLVGGRLGAQRVEVVLNGRPITSWRFDRPATEEEATDLPAAALRGENRLWLHLPDAAAPRTLGAGPEPRRIGLAVEALALGD